VRKDKLTASGTVELKAVQWAELKDFQKVVLRDECWALRLVQQKGYSKVAPMVDS
jgi:hypothetical protein